MAETPESGEGGRLPPLDPYRAAGLRHNPFVAEPTPGVDPRVRIDVGLRPDPGAAVVELVGCKGAGKTTHLMAWLDGDTARYRHVAPGTDRLRRLPVGPVGGTLAWDEVDRVPGPLLRRAVGRARRRGTRVLLGTHVPTGLADQSLTLPAPTPALVSDFAARRIAAAALGTGTTALHLTDDVAREVAAASDGCWWAVGTALHVWAAGQVRAAGVRGAGG